MGFLSFFKRSRSRRTLSPSFKDYAQSAKIGKKAPIQPKKQSILDAGRSKHTFRSQRNLAEKTSKFKFFAKIILIVFFSSCLFYLTFISKFFEIQAIDLQGSNDTLQEQSATQEYLTKYIGKNIIFFAINEHERTLLKKYPYLKKLNIRRDFFHKLVVEIETYPHTANIEITKNNIKISEVIVNANGAISAIDEKGTKLPSFVMDISGTSLESKTEEPEKWKLNQKIIEQSNLETLLGLKKSFEDKFDLKVKNIEYLRRARELHILTERDFFVWIDATQDVQKQLIKLKKAMAKLNIYEENLLYIDLRISGQNGEKVIYKLQ